MTRLLLAFALTLGASASAAPFPFEPIEPRPPVPLASAADYSVAEYAAYSKTLERIIRSPHPGLRLEAVRQLVRYGDHVEAGIATFDVVRLYRDARDPRVRLLALSALHAGGDPWAVDFLRRSVPYERDARLRHVMQAIVAAHAAAR